MASPTKQSIVVKSAFAAAVSDRHDMIRFPARACRSPLFPRGAVARRRLGSRPLPVRLHDVKTADPTDSLVALLDLLTDIPGTAANLPFVDARVAAERATRWCDGSVAPAANGLSSRISIRFAPLFGGNDAGAAGAHAMGYRRIGARALGLRGEATGQTGGAPSEPRIATPPPSTTARTSHRGQSTDRGERSRCRRPCARLARARTCTNSLSRYVHRA